MSDAERKNLEQMLHFTGQPRTKEIVDQWITKANKT